MTVYYLDSSVALRALVGHSRSAAEWIDATTADPAHVVVSSRILQTELTRVLRREGIPVRRRDEILDVLALIPMTEGTMAAAESIGPHLRTLDAIHLGALIASGLDAVVVTHDAAMRSVAAEIGYRAFDPVTTT